MGDDLAELVAVDTGEVAVEEDDVVVLVVHVVQRIGGALGCSHGADQCGILEEEGQFVQCGRFVVDRKYGETDHPAATPT